MEMLYNILRYLWRYMIKVSDKFCYLDKVEN